MKTIERLFIYLTKKNLPYTNIEKSLGLSNGYLKKMLNKKASIGSHILEKIVSTYPDLNPAWLLTGKGEMLINNLNSCHSTALDNIDNDTQPFAISNNLYTEMINIPILSGIEILNRKDFNSLPNADMEFSIRIPHKLLKKKGNIYFAPKITQHDMIPSLQPSGYGIITKLNSVNWRSIENDEIYIVITNHQTYLRRIKKTLKKDYVTLSSDNPDKITYPDFDLKLNQIIEIWNLEAYFSVTFPYGGNYCFYHLLRLEEKLNDIERQISDLTCNK